jgi:transposase
VAARHRHRGRARRRARATPFLAARYDRVRARRGANRASLAVADSLLVAVWRMLQTGETCLDPGGDYHGPPRPARTTRRPVVRHERLGYSGTLQEVRGAA